MWDTDEGSVGVVEIILPEYIFCDCIWGTRDSYLF